MKTLPWMALLLSAALLSAAASYRVIGEIPIGGQGFWDYAAVDAGAHHLYLSHGTKVVVVDIGSKKVIGEIPDTKGVHGIAIADKLNRGFTSNGQANTVTIFDLKTLAKVGEAKTTGQNPDAIVYDPASERVFTLNGRSNNATAINAKTGAVEGTIALDGKPEFAVADGKGMVYDNLEDKHEIVAIDTRSLMVTKHYSLEGCEEPSGLAMDVKHRRLFSVCGNKVMAVSDPDAGKVVALVPIGQGPDAAAYDPGTGLAFSSNGGDGTLTVVKESGGKYEVAQTVTTARSARTMALDTKTHNIYLPAAETEPAPAPTAANPRPRPRIKPDSFKVIIVGR